MKKKTVNDDIVSMFGLTVNQTKIMFSIQQLITEWDCQLSENKKIYDSKIRWKNSWSKSIIDYLNTSTDKKEEVLYDADSINQQLKTEIEKSKNKSWYYILVLECLTFVPYTALAQDKDKEYNKCKFNEKSCQAKLVAFLIEQEHISEDKIKRLSKCYKKNISTISGKKQKIALSVVSVLAVTALAALCVALMAPQLAVALVGAQFQGLSGAALTSACLAAIGGGAVAVGGLGMSGGVAILAGGGALLGLAGSSTAAGLIATFSNSPEFTLTQSAKLETILKEVVLNVQQDVVTAQKIISQCQESIDVLNKKLTDLQIKDAKNKKEIKNLQKSIDYILKSCKNMQVFTSSYEIGLEAGNE
jgi:hypothetical protein